MQTATVLREPSSKAVGPDGDPGRRDVRDIKGAHGRYDPRLLRDIDELLDRAVRGGSAWARR